jgi:threonine/homoserine/homoserine lactone efflux protein
VPAAVVAGLLAGYAVAVPVGAVAAYLVTLTARTSLRVGLAGGLGVATADGVYAAVAAAGGTGLAAALAAVHEPLRWLSVAVLVAVALRAVGAARGVAPAVASSAAGAGWRGTGRPGGAYVALLGLTLANPATVVSFTAVALGLRTGGAASAREAGAFVAAAALASLSWQALLAGVGASLARVLGSPRGRAATAYVSGALLLALALRVALG